MGQKCLFFRAGGASQNGVAMGETTEAGDDVAVLNGIVEHPLAVGVVAQLAEQFNALVLMLQVFAMFQGQVDEPALNRLELYRKVGCDRALGHCQRLSIGGKGARPIAKQVAGKLIQQ